MEHNAVTIAKSVVPDNASFPGSNNVAGASGVNIFVKDNRRVAGWAAVVIVDHYVVLEIICGLVFQSAIRTVATAVRVAPARCVV